MGVPPFRWIPLALFTSACQLVGDITERDLACEATPPATGGPRARIANLAVEGGAIEVCFADGKRLPVVAPECPQGVAYGEVSTPARAKPGPQHVRVVPAGEGCEAHSLFEADIELSDEGNTIAWIGGGSRARTLLVLPEAKPEGKTVRVIHAVTDLGPLVVGLADARGLPATIDPSKAVADIEFGMIPPAVLNGYMLAPPVDLNYGVALPGETEAKFVSFVSRETPADASFTMFVIGGDGKPHQSLLCEEKRFTGDRTACSKGTPVDISFEMFDAVLTGLLLPYATERKSALKERIGAFDSDVLCLAELWPESTKQEVALAAEEAYPFQYSAGYDAASPLTDPTGLGGKPPPAPRSEPYCATDEAKQKLEALIGCLRENCAKPATDDGLVQDSSCPTTACISESQGLLPHLECGVCTVYMIGGSTLAEIRDACTVKTEPYAFDGASGLLILSRHPLEDTSAFLAASTLVRRDILHARVRHPAGSAADVYCAHSPPIPAAAEIYPGVYGDGANGVEAWRNERKLFDEKLFGWVDATSHAPRSIVMGVFGTSPAGAKFAAVEPDVYELLTQHFPLAAPPGFALPCTLCAENPLVLSPAFGDFVLWRGEGSVLGASVTRKSAVVSVTNSLGAKQIVPLSSHYGFHSKLRFVP